MMLNFTELKNSCNQQWSEYINHRFVGGLSTGTLPIGNFKYYLCQDYVFLMEYAKAWGYGIYLSKTQRQIEFCGKNVAGLLGGEIELHIQFCKAWGIDKQQVFNTTAHKNNSAYTNYVLQCGENYGFVDLITALAPCAIGYAEIGNGIVKNNKTLHNDNPYQAWIDTYAGTEFQQGADEFIEFINQLYADIDAKAKNRQYEIFKKATELEIGFWDMGLTNTL